MTGKRISFLAAFFMPLLIAIIVCIDHEVFPFGDQCILQVDMYHQYAPFFTELMEKLKTGGSFFYSWRIGLGADFLSLYAYYLASPLNWLLLLWPSGYVIEFMTILVLLKIALCGLTFAYYLTEHFHTQHAAVSIFGTAYALSAFMAAYSWNIMWTDCMVLLPLVILGLERMTKGKSPTLYYVTLSLSILSNYYISIMVCIFLVLWFFLCQTEDGRGGILAWARFLVYSLLAGGTGAVLLLPTAIVLGKSSAQAISFPKSVEWYFHIVAELARHFVVTETYTGQNHWPNLYCGVFVLVFFVLFLLNQAIPWKRRLSFLLLVVFFVLSFANNMLDFVWHGLHFPTSLPARQSFLYVFVLLVLSFESTLHLQQSKLRHVLVAGGLSTGFFLIVYRLVLTGNVKAEGVESGAFWATALLVFCYLIFVAVYLTAGIRTRGWALAIGCLVMIAELTVNFDLTGFGTTGRSAYLEKREDYAALLAIAAENEQKEGDAFWRVEELERMTKNDAPLFGYASATQFSSLMNLDVSHFYQTVGMEGGKNFYCISGATPLLSAMLSVRYVLADNGLEENPMRRLVAQSGNAWLYENTYVLPFGFVMPEEVAEFWDGLDKTVDDIGIQDELAYRLGAKSKLFVPVADVSMPGETVIEVKEDGYYYASYGRTELSNLTLEVSDGRNRSYTKVSHGYLLDLGYCRAGSEIRIKNTDNQTLALSAYRLDMSAFDAAYQTLAEQGMKTTLLSDTRVKGSIQMTKPGRLIFSIAKEPGWTLLVDGVPTEGKAFGGAFFSVSLAEGAHKIVLSYETPRVWAGAGISGGCVGVFLLLMAGRWWRLKRRK
ncbi:MAG: YfhO family protein [Roseburia sp.]